MFCQASCADTRNAISSPVSVDGAMRFASQGGPMIDLFGRVPVLANLSARQAKELRLMTSGTYGRRSTISSKSVSLQSSLESRLRAKMLMYGSTLYKLTWKPWATPLGQSRSRLRASAPRISATEFIGLDMTSPAPLASWVTPAARDWKDSGADITPRSDGTERFDQLPRQANLSGWPTTTVQDAARGAKDSRPWDTGRPLNQIASMAGWTTPSASDGERAGTMTPNMTGSSLTQLATLTGPARLTASGEMLTGSSAEMESGGQLNPAHSRWLMGYPVAWCRAAVSAWRLMPTKRQRQG